jgi:hypothetical protein
LKFDNLLNKKVKDLEVLSSSLVYKEQELLVKFKDRLEEEDLEENIRHYEKKGLLDDSESDEDEGWSNFETGNHSINSSSNKSKNKI